MPVLPLVFSTMVAPGSMRPSRSALSRMYCAIRSLMAPPGFMNSHLAYTAASFGPASLWSRTRGVRPIACKMLSKTGIEASPDPIVDSFGHGPQRTWAGVRGGDAPSGGEDRASPRRGGEPDLLARQRCSAAVRHRDGAAPRAGQERGSLQGGGRARPSVPQRA